MGSQEKDTEKVSITVASGDTNGERDGIGDRSTAGTGTDTPTTAAEKTAAKKTPRRRTKKASEAASKKAPTPTTEVKQTRKPRQSRAAKQKALAEESANLFIGLVNEVAVGMLGENARMTPTEQVMTQTSLTRMLERASPQAIERVSHITDPIMLGLGLVLWGGRLVTMTKPPAPPLTEEKPSSPQTELPLEWGGIAVGDMNHERDHAQDFMGAVNAE